MIAKAWLLVAGVALHTAAWPLPPSCQKIVELDPSLQERDYLLLDQLRDACDEERSSTPVAKLAVITAALDLRGELERAHVARIASRTMVLDRGQALVADLRTMTPDQVAQLADPEFGRRTALLREIASSLQSLGGDGIIKYLRPEARQAVDLSVEAGEESGGLAEIVLSRFREASAKSDRTVAGLDQRILEVLQGGDAALRRLRTGAALRFDSTFREGLLQGVGAQVLDLKGSIAWEKFLQASRLRIVLQDAEFRIQAGMLATARGRADYADLVVARFMAALPQTMATRIAAGPARQITDRIAAIRMKTSSESPTATESRIAAYVGNRAAAIEAARASCKLRMGLLSAEIARLDQDLATLAADRMRFVEEIDTRLWVYESMAARMDAVRELCAASE